jgi:CDP-glucose 4,6-dehydratase
MKFWRRKRVFVTGHTGFKGSWLSLALSHLGAKVTGYALRPSSEPSLFELAKISQLVSSQFGDIRDLDKLRSAMTRSAPDIVIHMAAQPIVRCSYEDPLESFETNVMGTVNVLEACRATPSLSVVLNITTDKVYENLESASIAYREGHALGGHDPYSSSKACSEIVSQSYHRSFFVPGGKVRSATARCGNVIGGGDWAADRIIPDLVRSWSRSKDLWIRSPNAIRPWLHVLDGLHGYLKLSELLWKKKGSSDFVSFNFAPSRRDHISVRNVVEILKMDLDIPIKYAKGPKPHEAQILILNAQKARRELGWRPRLSVSEALHWTASWYKDFYSGKNARDLVFKQLSHYWQEGL